MTKVGVHFTAFLSFVLSTVAADAQQQSYGVQEADVHNHHFYSERRRERTDLIEYVVCNTTDSESDFFWTVAAFGVSEFDPLPAHHCLQKKDYLSRTESLPEDAHSGSAKVYVSDQSAEVPTVYWCEFNGLDRCADNLSGTVALWLSTLREFAEGSSEPANRPIIEVSAALEGGRYQIDIRRSEVSGNLLIIAKSPPSDEMKLEAASGVEASSVSLGDLFTVSGERVTNGLSTNMFGLSIVSPAASDQGVRLFFDNQSSRAIELAILIASDDGIVYRIDTLPLAAPR